MGLGCKALLVTAALACAAAPAFGAADATFTAVDYAWRANNTDATTLTIAPGQTVMFGYPAGTSAHNVKFTGRVPDCTGLSPTPRAPGWTTECTFTVADAYPFICILHPDMRGTVVSPRRPRRPRRRRRPIRPRRGPRPPRPRRPPRASRRPLRRSRPGSPYSSRAARRARACAGACRWRRPARGWRSPSARARRRPARGRRSRPPRAASSFSVALNAKTRKALRAKHRLRLAVRVTLTAPGAKTLTSTATATVSL